MLIELKDIRHVYNLDDPVVALENINLEITQGEFIGLIGHTGSGKSTLVQLLNGLLQPTAGQVFFQGQDINADRASLQDIRKKIGLVFQYPEHQLFEETVAEDVAFGPKNVGLSREEREKRVKEALQLVGLDYEEFKDRSPFNLSGGQQRRVAIAGVLALKPEVLILDEPSAGLDPEGRQKLLDLLVYLHQELNLTIILISHRMEEVARLASRVVVMDQGKIALEGTPAEVFNRGEDLKKMDLDLPVLTQILTDLKARGLPVRTDIFSLEKARDEILAGLKKIEKSRESKTC